MRDIFLNLFMLEFTGAVCAEFSNGCFWVFSKNKYLERKSVMKTLIVKLVSTGLVIGTAAFGSGYQCDGYSSEGVEWAVKMYNHASVESRVPAVLVVSNEAAGTLLRRSDAEIKKVNRRNTVQYVIEGNRKIDADTVIFQVAHKEGKETLEPGQVTTGQLILVKDEAREVIELTCSRYLKN